MNEHKRMHSSTASKSLLKHFFCEKGRENEKIHLYLLTAKSFVKTAWKLVNIMSIDWNYICDSLKLSSTLFVL